MNPYLDFVRSIEQGVCAADLVAMAPSRTTVVESDSKVLLFSPHPDDECVIGALPLRLMREAGKQIINIPVTFGSNVERREARARELADACAYLGWRSFRPDASLGPLEVPELVSVLQAFTPEVVFFPHEKDWNTRHISTHALAMAALRQMGEGFGCIVVETEFWGAMSDPNLAVEADAALVADLVAATALHVGEVARNPYHLHLPAWMQDNVRRGGELVGGQGHAAPDFSFATLYRVRRWQHGALTQVLGDGEMLAMQSDRLGKLFAGK